MQAQAEAGRNASRDKAGKNKQAQEVEGGQIHTLAAEGSGSKVRRVWSWRPFEGCPPEVKAVMFSKYFALSSG